MITAIAVSTTYQPTVDASAARRGRVRGSRRASATIGATSTRSAHRAAHSSACPRSRIRTLTIENTSVIASSTIAIADAYPAWLRWNACCHR